ncbi:TrbC/VirB2 family protein [Dickeya oryzae]|uniref:TrbC/VirB2 family protein n=1 Tax=Dickeya oryzae TaxID=1240404 RepID=UPI001AECE75A|nr:TrbC/VirB2 family protein [Dickeya oryzae]MBP2845813.1 TrbC/VirB2 family protein [Dickeya oryzae]
MKLNKTKKMISVAFSTTGAIVSSSAMADGFTKANTLLEKVASGLEGLAIATISIAALIVGYRTLFDGRALSESKNIMIGGIIIASVAEIASMLVS